MSLSIKKKIYEITITKVNKIINLLKPLRKGLVSYLLKVCFRHALPKHNDSQVVVPSQSKHAPCWRDAPCLFFFFFYTSILEISMYCNFIWSNYLFVGCFWSFLLSLSLSVCYLDSNFGSYLMILVCNKHWIPKFTIYYKLAYIIDCISPHRRSPWIVTYA